MQTKDKRQARIKRNLAKLRAKIESGELILSKKHILKIIDLKLNESI